MNGENSKKPINIDEIAFALASRYEVIYYINIATNEYTTYSSSDIYAELGTTKQGTDFFAELIDDVKKFIYKEDIDYVLSQLDKDTLLKNLKHSGMVVLTYRQQLGDDIKYVTLNVIRPKNDPDHIVMGLLNVDAQMKREQSILKQSELFNNVIIKAIE